MPSTPEQINIQQIQALFTSCERREKDLKKDGIDQVRHQLAKELIFGPVFEAAPQPQNAIEEAIRAGTKYRKLIVSLKKARDRQARWILLARWLRQENVCEPENFLPKEANLVSSLNKPWKGIRRDDPLYVSLVEIWLPYFQVLVQDVKDLKRRRVRRVREELVKNGHDEDAVGIAVNKRSAVEAIYSWLEFRRKVSAATFRNAYARISSSIKRLHADQIEQIFAKEINDLAAQGRTSPILKGRQSSAKHRPNKSQ